jgi:hypothetical protein
MNERYTYEVYRANSIFLLIRAITFTLFTFKVTDAVTNSIVSGIVSFSIATYFAIHIHKNFGVKALERKVFQDLLDAKGSFGNDAPVAMWIKEYDSDSDDFIMRDLNVEYEKLFLTPIGKIKSNYIGRTDYDIQPLDIAKSYEEADREILETGTPKEYTERFSIGNGETKKGIFKKWKAGDKYVCGICLIV